MEANQNNEQILASADDVPMSNKHQASTAQTQGTAMKSAADYKSDEKNSVSEDMLASREKAEKAVGSEPSDI